MSIAAEYDTLKGLSQDDWAEILAMPSEEQIRETLPTFGVRLRKSSIASPLPRSSAASAS